MLQQTATKEQLFWVLLKKQSQLSVVLLFSTAAVDKYCRMVHGFMVFIVGWSMVLQCLFPQIDWYRPHVNNLICQMSPSEIFESKKKLHKTLRTVNLIAAEKFNEHYEPRRWKIFNTGNIKDLDMEREKTGS